MSNYDGEIRAAGDALLLDLGIALARSRIATDRHDALALYLAGDEGWRDARDALRGTFAAPSGATRLTAASE